MKLKRYSWFSDSKTNLLDDDRYKEMLSCKKFLLFVILVPKDSKISDVLLSPSCLM